MRLYAYLGCISLLVLINQLVFSSAVTIVCVGDSITYGTGASDVSKTSYPSRLSDLLNGPNPSNTDTKPQNYTVLNFGVRNAAAKRNTDSSYWKTHEYEAALKVSKPDIVIILFGANDAKYGFQWNEQEFTADYTALVESFKSLSNHPTVYLGIPTVILPWYASTKVNSTVINGEYPVLIPRIAQQLGVHVISFFASVGGTGTVVTKESIQYFVRDGLHPNDRGYMAMAQAAYAAIAGHTIPSPTS